MSTLSVHKGSKVLMSLCVCRLPTRFNEPLFAKQYREWHDEWKDRTCNKLNITDGLAYIKTPGHFLPSIEERARRASIASPEGATAANQSLELDEIEQLLSSEGIPELRNQIGSSSKADDTDIADDVSARAATVERTAVEWLIVKYKACPSVWTFPFIHRRESDSTFVTLQRLCRDYLGMKPHLQALAPIAFRRITTPDYDVSSRMFYYKGVHVPNTPSVRLSDGSDILEHTWVTKDDLQQRLTRSTWVNVRDALPLD